jgi:sugar phosphate permease
MVAATTWRHTFAIVGVFTLIISPLCFMFVRNAPTEVNLPSIEEIEGREIINKHIEKPHLLEGLIKVISNPNTWLIFVFFCGFNGASIALIGTWGSSYVADVYGIPVVSAANYTAAAATGIAIGSIIIGKF